MFAGAHLDSTSTPGRTTSSPSPPAKEETVRGEEACLIECPSHQPSLPTRSSWGEGEDIWWGWIELGYFDRVESRVVVVSFYDIEFPQDAPQVFRIVDEEGRVHRVPFHRVREVYKDGQRIWHRPTETQ